MTGKLTFSTLLDGVYMHIDCGIVISIDDTPHVSISRTKIPTYSAENAFLFDTGATDTYTITVKRLNPTGDDVVNDSSVYTQAQWGDTTRWSNRVWKEALTLFINRWQARTDGCIMSFIPEVQVQGGFDEHDLFQRRIDNINVYIKTMSFDYDTSSAELITVNMTVVMGSMCGRQRVRW